MMDSALVGNEIEEILSMNAVPPEVVRRDGKPLSVGEQHCLVLQPESYRVECAGLERLTSYLLALDSNVSREVFWNMLSKRVRHPIIPCFFIAQGRMIHLLEWILDELDRSPLDERLIVMSTSALKVEHGRYSVEELEKISELIGTLLAQSQLGSGARSLTAKREAESEIGPEIMQVMRARRDIYRALGTLQEVVRGALYCKLAGMLSDS
jgi:hypothetical protein